jgi:DNA-binding NtrC family response regulator
VPDLPPYLQSGEESREGSLSSSSAAAPAGAIGGLEDQERALVIRAMEASGGNQSQAARTLRIGRDALRYKLKKYGLTT